MMRAHEAMVGADDDFVREYASFVRGVATQTKLALGLDCDEDDLVAFGYEGLLQARERFEPARGVPFKSFAYYRVRGALLDGVRSMAYLPRRAHARMKAAHALDRESELLGEANAAAKPGNTPQLDVKLRAIDGMLGRVAAAYTSSLCASEPAGLDGKGELVADRSTSPEEVALSTERRTLTRKALETLPEQERFLIEGHYVQGRPFDELARELGLSKSWASRLHTRALDRLRSELATLA